MGEATALPFYFEEGAKYQPLFSQENIHAREYLAQRKL